MAAAVAVFVYVSRADRNYGKNGTKCIGAGCAPDGTIAYAPVGIFFHAFRLATVHFVIWFSVLSSFIPFVFVCRQVSSKVGDTIGLWNQSHTSLEGMQKRANRLVLRCSVVTFIFMGQAMFFRVYYDLTTELIILYSMLAGGVILSAIIVPIIPVIVTLRKYKRHNLATLSVYLERAHVDMMEAIESPSRNPEATSRAVSELALINGYISQVSAASVIPGGLEVLRTSVASIGMGVVLPAVLSVVLS